MALSRLSTDAFSSQDSNSRSSKLEATSARSNTPYGRFDVDGIDLRHFGTVETLIVIGVLAFFASILEILL